jgi:hypothetical protein
MVAVACTSPDLVGGDDARGSESVTNDAQSDATSQGDQTTDEGSTTDSGAVTDETATGDQTTEEEPAPDPGDQTTPTAADESPLATNPPKDNRTTSTSSPASGGGTIDPSLSPFIDQAKADLAGRLGVSASAITVISAELVSWSDASLGCPKPGMEYAQVLTDGSLIVLSHGGMEYRYHTGGSVYVPFLCE